MTLFKCLKFGSKLKISECFFLLFVLWSSGTLLSTDSALPLYGLVISFLFVLAEKGIVNWKRFPIIILTTLLLCCFSFLQYIIFTDIKSSSIVFKLFFLLLITVLFSQSSSERNLERIGYFVKLIILFSLISNLIYIIFIFGGGLTYQISSTTESMHFHYLEMVCHNSLPGFSYRNGGIFWEPGMYQVYLSFALIYCLYIRNIKFRLLLICYLLLSIVSTFSVTGYIITAAIFMIYSFRNNSGAIGKLFIIFIIFAGLIMIMPYLLESLVEKQSTGSYAARSNDLFFGLSIFFDNPLFGVGLGHNTYVNAYAAKFGEARQSSNGMTNLLIQFGLFGFSIVSLYVYRFARFLKKYISPSVFFTILLWIIISANSEPIVYHPFMFLIIGIGLSYSINHHKICN